MDDKVIVFVGEFYKLILVVSRVYYRGLVNINSVNLIIDYDYYICGIVFLVCLFVDILDNSRGFFYYGDVYIIFKDKIFQLLIFFCYVVEIVKIVRSYFSEDDVNVNKLIIVRYIDGGLDYRLIFVLVQLVLILEFIVLDFDMVIVCRCVLY